MTIVYCAEEAGFVIGSRFMSMSSAYGRSGNFLLDFDIIVLLF